MTGQLEDALARTLHAAAEDAPGQPPGLAHQVDVRFRKRRRRTYAAVAGVAVFAVVGGSALAGGALTGRGPDTVGVPAATGELPPVAEVWPEAVHALPDKLADGRKYRIESMVDDHRLLIATEASFENANELWLMDLETRKAHRIVELPKPHAGRLAFASHFTTGSGHVVWWDSYTEDKQYFTRIWKAPLDGGEPTLVSTVTGAYGSSGPVGDRLLVHGDHVYFSHSMAGGVRKVPLAGGEASLINGTAGYHLVAWPWIGTPGEDHGGFECTLGPDGEPRCEGGDQEETRTCTLDPQTEEPVCPGDDQPPASPRAVDEYKPRVFTTIRNLETGEERTAKLPFTDMQSVFCGIEYCHGSNEKGAYTWRRDGSGLRTLPGEVWMMVSPPAWDRFLVIGGESPALYDIVTGKQADMGIVTGPDGGMSVPDGGRTDERALQWTADTRIVFDMAAVK